MKIKILKATVCGKFVKAGEIIDASDGQAKVLIGMGKAEVHVEPAKAKPAKVEKAEKVKEAKAKPAKVKSKDS